LDRVKAKQRLQAGDDAQKTFDSQAASEGPIGEPSRPRYIQGSHATSFI
jgi:hypothetical protein